MSLVPILESVLEPGFHEGIYRPTLHSERIGGRAPLRSAGHLFLVTPILNSIDAFSITMIRHLTNFCEGALDRVPHSEVPDTYFWRVRASARSLCERRIQSSGLPGGRSRGIYLFTFV